MSARSFGSARRSVATLLVTGVVAFVVALTAGSAARAAGTSAVSQGLAAALLPTTPSSVFGDTPADTPENVSFILRINELGALEAQVQHGMSHGFLSVSDFAHRYGQSSKNITALETYLANYGISSQAMANGLDIQTSGTAGQYDAALSVQQKEFKVTPPPAFRGAPPRAPIKIHGTKQTPLLPKDLAKFVLAILGLTSYPIMQSQILGLPADAKPAGASTSLKPGKRSNTSLPNTALLPSDFATRYDLDPVYNHGAGAGRTIGIVTLASVNPNTVSDFWNAIGLNGNEASANRMTLVNVDGGSGPVTEALGSDETTIDAEQSGAVAPDANIRIYQAPNGTDYGFVDAFFQAASDNVADTVATSWGLSETAVKASTNIGVTDPNYAQTFDEAFLELAAQGQSAFASSGDSGAYDDSAIVGSTDLSVDQPADSPWITAAGGTTLPGSLTIGSAENPPPVTVNFAAERTWAWDWLWPVLLFRHPDRSITEVVESTIAGTGGGYSTFYPMPDYQRGIPGVQNFSAVPYLTPIDPVQAFGLTLSTDWSIDLTPTTIQGLGDGGRAIPDVSTDADPETGYLVLYTFGDSQNPNAPESVEQFGGTSFVSQQLGASTVVIDSALGRRIGFLNPWVYQFATMKGASPFTPLDTSGRSNDNLYYSGTPGNIYNPGSGLGTPDFAKLWQAIANSSH
jgi:subtilase family serine protease